MKKLAKLFLGIIVSSSMIFGSVGVFANTNQVVKVKIGSNIANVNGKNITMDAVPYIQEYTNVTMIPLRFVATALGIDDNDIIYDAEEKRVTINANKRFNEADQVIYFLNYHMGDYGYAELKNGRTYIPLRVLCDNLGLSVEWDATTKTATMKANINQNNNQTQNSDNQNINNNSSNNNYFFNSEDKIDLSIVKQKLDNNNLTIIDENQFNELLELSKKSNDILYSELQVIKSINEERVKNGLNPLLVSVELMQVAKSKVNDMQANNYFSHYDKNGNSSFAQYLGIEEDLTSATTPDSIISSFMNSSLHKASLMRENHKYIGVGINNSATAIFLDGKAGWQDNYSEWEQWYTNNK